MLQVHCLTYQLASDRALSGRATGQVVVADKNLVPSPHGNIQRVVNILKDSGIRFPSVVVLDPCLIPHGTLVAGAATLAIVPLVTGTTSAESHPDLYAGIPDLPFPLELITLCMLRTLTRKNHEGKLDGCEWGGTGTGLAL